MALRQADGAALGFDVLIHAAPEICDSRFSYCAHCSAGTGVVGVWLGRQQQCRWLSLARRQAGMLLTRRPSALSAGVNWRWRWSGLEAWTFSRCLQPLRMKLAKSGNRLSTSRNAACGHNGHGSCVNERSASLATALREDHEHLCFVNPFLPPAELAVIHSDYSEGPRTTLDMGRHSH